MIKRNCYICIICQTNKFINITEQTTDTNDNNIKDINNEYHDHNILNKGTTTLKCTNNHITLQKYISNCWCGWTPNGGISRSTFNL